MGHVFISFASADAEVAHRVVQRLESSGLRCWISNRDIPPAASYPAAITTAVSECGALLLLLSDAANNSPHVLREIELAFTKRRRILPVRVGGAVPSPDLQFFLTTTQWLDAGAEFDDGEIARVERRIRDLIEKPAAIRGHGRVEPPWWRRRAVVAAAKVVVAAAAALVFWMAPANDLPAQPAVDREPPETAPRPATDPNLDRATPTGASGPQIKVNPRDGQAYVWIPPGRFLMGCSPGDGQCEEDEKPVHQVEIRRGFWLARTEVTVAQYAKASDVGKARAEDLPGALPATGMTWAAAKAYCESVGGRLPTEAEWEYAARGGATTRYYDNLSAIAWFADNTEEGPRPVGQKTPNAFGLYDMLGNVSEWVRDRYYNAYDDRSGPETVEEPLSGNATAVARGGSWMSAADGVRVSRRIQAEPQGEVVHIGVRCAVDRL